MIRDKEVTLEYVPSPDFWYCKRVSTKNSCFRIISIEKAIF